MIEIGSEFWLEENKESSHTFYDFLHQIGKDRKFFASGRTSLDYILEEINKDGGIVYMPDYCCQSMIQPFLDRKYIINYYKTDLINNKYEINPDEQCDIFFGMSYFGYGKTNMDKYIAHFKKRNIITIEDITHRLLSDRSHCDDSDYIFCSIRKWLPVLSGGIAINNNTKFKTSTECYSVDENLVKERKKAMELKRDYINGLDTNKEDFLKLYSDSNQKFKNYNHKAIDKETLEMLKRADINEIKDKRKKNALIIYEEIKNKHISTLELDTNDTPLFVPIFLDEKLRNSARGGLAAEKSIYLPVHWPVETQPQSIQSNRELSLVCDQRYSEETTKKYIKTVVNYLESYNA